MKISSQLNSYLVKSLLLIILMLYACGLDGSNGYLAGGGQSGTGVTVGPVTAFSSIWVNGIRFDTTQAEIFVDGEAVGQGDTAARRNLAIGQVVRVQGTIADDDTGSADQVYYEKNLEGPIGAINRLDPYTLQVTIMGQRVIADNNTTWVGIDADALTPDMILELSGQLDSDGTLQATYIALKDDAMTYTVKGSITNLDTAMATFTVNGLTVDFSTAAGSMFPLSEGDLVRVKGMLTENDTLEASDLSFWNPTGDPEPVARDAVIDGVVNRFESAQDFFVNHYPVTTDDQTIFQNITAEELANGIRVLITGNLMDGVLYADTVQLKTDFEFLKGTVQRIDTENRTVVLAGAPGALIRVNRTTIITGRVDTFEALALDDVIMVNGWRRPDGSISAIGVFVLPTLPSFP